MVGLNDPETWEIVAEAMGDHDHDYDLGDRSHRLDVVQLVCEAAAKAGYEMSQESPDRARRQLEFLEILADGGAITVNGMPWREVFEKLNAVVSDPV